MGSGHIIAVNRPGDPGWIQPGSEQHRAAVSPSKVAAMLGFSRWQSPFGLWQEMAGNVEPDPPKDIFTVGHDAEPYMARRWLRLNPGWRLSPDEVQLVIDPDHFGFPAMVTLDRRAVRGRARRVVQCKIARDLGDADTWGDDLAGDGDAPPDYATQVFAEMLFSGFTQHDGHLMVAGPFWAEKLYPIRFDAGTAAGLLHKIRTFWKSLQANETPDLDDTAATYQTVRKLHPDIDQGATVEVDPALAERVLILDHGAKQIAADLRGAKTALLAAMGAAQYAVVGDIKIADRRPHARGGVALNLATKNAAAIDQHNNPEGIPA